MVFRKRHDFPYPVNSFRERLDHGLGIGTSPSGIIQHILAETKILFGRAFKIVSWIILAAVRKSAIVPDITALRAGKFAISINFFQVNTGHPCHIFTVISIREMHYIVMINIQMTDHGGRMLSRTNQPYGFNLFSMQKIIPVKM